ncbi:class I SAM-dependent methyltransferase [Photobacterium nomapromontoriensis]|uniref:class I SAM-dependent methyltransferase n=1 Tax=Photobacterium nomapromontoriensis TaxID=2910237 RepID=UPI003D0EB262
MTDPTRYDIPADLLHPLWLRSRESLSDNRLLYDPVAAAACSQCVLKPDCLLGNVTAQQLLHASVAQLCDRQVQQFLRRHPSGRILNLGGGLDTRFYRIDNGRCRWFDIDFSEHLVWRQRLFHRSERYRMLSGSIDDLAWLQALPTMNCTPVMLVCDQALLQHNAASISRFLQAIACHFGHLELCLVLAGDRCHQDISHRMGVVRGYAHGFRDPRQQVLCWLPWAESVGCYSPLDNPCTRWRRWQRWIAFIPGLKYRVLPVVLNIRL